MREKTITLDGIQYTIRALTYREKKDAKNGVSEIVIEHDPITGERRQREVIKMGDYQARVIFAGLKSWSIRNEKGEAIPLTWQNFLEYFPPDHDDVLFGEIMALSTLGENEKKT